MSNSFLHNFLNIHWLRPETALWRSLDVQAMEKFSFEYPSLDLGCGDGTFSFLRAGGQLALDFDVYKSVDNIDKFFQKVDVFNAFYSDEKPQIKKQPLYTIDYAFDHKENLLEKAKLLDFYKHTVRGDANKTLPFETNFFKSIFSNIIYWLDNPQTVFNEVSRILHKDGQCCVMLPNATFPDFSFYYNLYIKKQRKEFSFLELLDRGRMTDNIKQAKSFDEWNRIFKNANLQILDHQMHLSKPIIQIWDIGLRPLFPLLYEMTLNLQTDKLFEIKRKWIETFEMFLEPLMKMDSDFGLESKPAFHCFILKKAEVRLL